MTASDPVDPSAPCVPFSVIVAAAGAGRRLGGLRKAQVEICGRSLLHHAIDRLRLAPGCAEIIPVLHPEEYASGAVGKDLEAEFGITKTACGGSRRQDSVLAGLDLVDEELNIVLIHDAARPLVSPDVVRRVAEAARRLGAAIAALPATETVKEVGEGGRILSTPPRDRLWYARTPQGFRRDLILQAHRAAREDGFVGTDDAQLLERLGEAVYVVEDSPENIKITTPADLLAAEAILRGQARAE